MKVQVRFLLLVAVLLAITFPAFSRDIKTDYDHHANFSQYKTYSWGKVETQNPLWDDRIREAVNRELAKKGWTEAPADGDVTIMAMGTTHERPILRTFYDSSFRDGAGVGSVSRQPTSTTMRLGPWSSTCSTPKQEIDLARLSERHPSRQAGQSHEGSRKIGGEDVCPFPPVDVKAKENRPA